QQLIVQGNGSFTGSVSTAGNLNVRGTATFGSIKIGNANSVFALDVTGDINASQTLKIGGTTICTIQGCNSAGVTSLNALIGALVLQGSTSRISVSTDGGVITVTTPQDIATTSTPTF